VREAIGARLVDIGLELHPDKTKIVYCKDSRRRQEYELVSFTFCGYTFRPRKAYNKKQGQTFTSFLPAVAPGKLTEMSRKAASWRIHRRTTLTLDDLAKEGEPGPSGLACLLHRVLPERGDPTVRSHRPPSGALGKEEVRAPETQ
jgi:RNA-directed DNA polymerase